MGMGNVRFQFHHAGWVTGVAALVFTGAIVADDPDAMLQKIKARMSEHLTQMPNYVCHETVQRMVRVRSSWHHLDTVQFEVAFVGEEELFARPGSDRFGEEPIEQIARGGTIGNIMLGSSIDLLFSRNLAEFKFAGACKKDGRKTLRYDLTVPVEKSAFRVRHGGAEGLAGYDGTIWVDADTFDLVRVDYKVNRIPAHVGVILIEQSLHYKQKEIGNSQFNLPDHSELAATDSAGTYCLDMIKLDQCHEFGANSVVKYGAPVEGSAARDRDKQ
jgi:hypothetical protein